MTELDYKSQCLFVAGAIPERSIQRKVPFLALTKRQCLFFLLSSFFFFYLCVISTSHFPTQNPIRKTEALATKQPQTSALLVPFASTLQSSPLLL
jgi:hypothetical protein